jgi:hypothetical protein
MWNRKRQYFPVFRVRPPGVYSGGILPVHEQVGFDWFDPTIVTAIWRRFSRMLMWMNTGATQKTPMA